MDREDQYHFEIDVAGVDEVLLTCARCTHFYSRIAVDDVVLTLAELIDRADEHLRTCTGVARI